MDWVPGKWLKFKLYVIFLRKAKFKFTSLVISQVKSAVQVAIGDKDGAKETQINFTKNCPIVSQATSLVQALNGDLDVILNFLKIDFFFLLTNN